MQVRDMNGTMRELPLLDMVTVLSPLVVRIIGHNPGAYTLNGTNTYLIGSGKKRILWDSGDGEQPGYLHSLHEAMVRVGCETIDCIIVSHHHDDHVGGITAIQNKFGQNIPVFKYLETDNDEFFKKWPRERFQQVSDGQVIKTEGASLRLVHTPGHTVDHLIAILEEENSMFTSDNVLGLGTGVYENLSQYLNSLKLMHQLNPGSLYPGHGRHVPADESRELVQLYITHRMNRVIQVEQFLKIHPEGLDLKSLTRLVYVDVSEDLLRPAMKNSKNVLEYLAGEHQAENVDGIWSFIPTHNAL